MGEQRGIVMGEQRGMVMGEQRGMVMGEQRGMVIGEQRGMVIGMQEEKLALARVMLQDSEPIEKIMRWTGLSRQTIENIEQDLELAY
jgi:predicted transposase YdaD